MDPIASHSDESSEKPSAPSQALSPTSPQWKPLTAKQRRVLGTLMEKSKTTPDAYPMTYTGLTTGCNQKSNREPVTNFDTDQVEMIVDELRELGAVTIVQGSGRVTKVRHYAYNWLELSKTEAAVMTELLLRGEQTLGELRTRASRMEPIQDLQQLQEIFNELKRRNLVVELSPPGRGQIVTHNLYPEWELERLQGKAATKGGSSDPSNDEEPSRGTPTTSQGTSPSDAIAMETLQNELAELRESVSKLTARLEFLEKELGIEGTGTGLRGEA